MSYYKLKNKTWLWVGLIISLLLVNQGAMALELKFDQTATRWSGGNTTGGMYHGYIWETAPYVGSYIMGFKFCPLGLTGDVCNRPPLISTSDPRVDFDLPTENVIGYTEVYPRCECLNSQFRDLVPNGENYPSVGDWDIPFDGKHYYARINVNSADWTRVCIRWETDPETGEQRCVEWRYRTPIYFDLDTTVGEGSYMFHIQRDIPSPGNNDWAENSLTVQYGNVGIGFSRYEDGRYQPLVGNPTISETISVSGFNTDSSTTYLWLTGDDLPDCGINLMATTIEDTTPYIVYTSPNGVFPSNLSWDLSKLPISLDQTYINPADPSDRYKYGDFTIVVSSVLPNEDEEDCTKCGLSIPCGVKGLVECPVCWKDPVYVPIRIIEPLLYAEVTPVIERCCCPGYPCGALGGAERLILSGKSDINADNNEKQLQFWLFSDNAGTIGGKKLFFEYLTVDCDGYFTYDLTDYIFKQNNISLCDLPLGKYDIIIQNEGLNRRYDVIPDREIPDGDGTYEPEPNKQYVVSSYPLRWTKAFLFDGTNSKPSNEFIAEFDKTFAQPSIDDEYVYLSFEIKEDECSGGNVDFVADPLKGNAPLTVAFTDASTFRATTWNWDFGDDTTSTEQNPIHTYEYPSSFTVSLTASDGIDTKQMKKQEFIYVAPKPKVGFEVNPSSGNTSTVFQFTDISTDNPSSWLWDFGDNSTTNLQSPTHTYAKPGTYYITLTVSNEYGLSNSYYQTVQVLNNPPVAAFSASRTETKTYPAQINFLDTSTGEGIYSWLWDFGDNSTSTKHNPSHLYVDPGTYTVSLKVANNGGTNSKIIEDYITIGDIYSPDPNPKPVSFMAVPTLGNTPLAVQFTDTSEMKGINWTWDFGDGGVSDLKNPLHVYEKKGTFSVSLLLDDGTATNSTTIKNYITAVDVPIIDFSFNPTTAYSGEEIQFTDQSTGNPTSWMWDFGNEDTSSLQSPVYSYPKQGTYRITLTVSNAFGIGTPVTKDIVIMNDGPTAMFSANPLNSTSYPAEVYFTDTSIGEEITSWLWSFGDGGTSTTKNPIHIYTLPGVFDVSLTVANNGGTNTTEKTNYIRVGEEPGDGYTLNIYPKWNHFSIPADLVDSKNTVAEVFEGIDRGGEPAYIYSNELGDYKAIDEDTILVPQTMYKIWYNRNDQNKVVFEYKDWEGTYSRKLETGWNGIGITGPVPVPASEALKSLGTAWDKLIWYDGNKQDWMGPVERGKTDYTLMYPITGYMIDMNADATLEG